jgi:hypothetical protein
MIGPPGNPASSSFHDATLKLPRDHFCRILKFSAPRTAGPTTRNGWMRLGARQFRDIQKIECIRANFSRTTSRFLLGKSQSAPHKKVQLNCEILKKPATALSLTPQCRGRPGFRQLTQDAGPVEESSSLARRHPNFRLNRGRTIDNYSSPRVKKFLDARRFRTDLMMKTRMRIGFT